MEAGICPELDASGLDRSGLQAAGGPSETEVSKRILNPLWIAKAGRWLARMRFKPADEADG